MSPARRVVFVDDEPNVLSALQRMLRPMRQQWDMHFVTGGGEALALLESTSFDVIVTDMRMPRMDGAALLDEVSRSHPGMVRIVLSGQASQEAILRVVGPAHQYLSKPCDADELKAKLQQAFVLRDLLGIEALKSLVARLRSLPTLPAVYLELLQEMRSENASVNRIGQIVEQDLGMTAKLLQLVNSAFFGVRGHVGSAGQAVRLLGLDLVRTLMLSAAVGSQVDANTMTRYRLTKLWPRGLAMAQFVRVLARLEGFAEDLTAHAVTAAMLHDAGRLVLTSCLPDEYGAIVDRAQHEGRPLVDVEHETLGCTHAEVGAYLLGLWGLSDQVTIAVAWHHRPAASGITTLTPLALVHAADAIASELLPETEDAVAPPPDRDFLAGLGARCGYDTWKRECEAAAV